MYVGQCECGAGITPERADFCDSIENWPWQCNGCEQADAQAEHEFEEMQMKILHQIAGHNRRQ